YNFSQAKLESNVRGMIDFYNAQRHEYAKAVKKALSDPPTVDQVIDNNPKKISWTVNLKEDVRKQKSHEFASGQIVVSTYRPFCKQNLYFSRAFNERVLLQPRLFPRPDSTNLVISTTGVGARRAF